MFLTVICSFTKESEA